jgi:hypothetical protein
MITDITPIASDTMKKVADSTYERPAEEQTKRAYVAFAQTVVVCVLIGWIVVQVLPKLTDPRIIGGLVAIAVIIFGIPRAIKVFKGGE